MSTQDERTIKAALAAIDDDIDDMTEQELSSELAARGIDLKKSAAGFATFAEKALALARRRQLDVAEKQLAQKPKLDLMQKAIELTRGLGEEAIRALIGQHGGHAPAHREHDGTQQRDMLVQTLADVLAMNEER